MSSEWSRLYYLGGRISAQRTWADGYVRRALLVTAVSLAAALVYRFTGQRLVFLAVLVAAGVVFVLPRLREAGGDVLVDHWHAAAGRTVRRWLDWDAFDPSWESTPATWGRMSVMGVAATEGGAELGIVEHHTEQYFSAVLRLNGSTVGLVELDAQEDACRQVGQLLNTLAEANVVSQIDLVTRAVPASRDDYDQWVSEQAPGNPLLGQNLAQLGEFIEEATDRYVSWLVVRVPTANLKRKVHREGDAATTAALAAAMFDVVAGVGRLATQYGLNPAFGVTPRILGAMVRHLYSPSFSIDDISGVERAWDGVPAHSLDEHGRAVIVESGGWLHSVGFVPRDGWPVSLVTPRFLEALLVGIKARHRLIVAQFPLIPRYEATKRALAAAAAGLAEQGAHRGQVTTGEAADGAAVSQSVLRDIRGTASGVRPTLRVMVSARTMRELAEARAEVDHEITRMGCTRFTWHDRDHSRGLVTILPFARGVKS